MENLLSAWHSTPDVGSPGLAYSLVQLIRLMPTQSAEYAVPKYVHENDDRFLLKAAISRCENVSWLPTIAN